MENYVEMHEEEVLSPEPFKFNPEPDQKQPDLNEQEQDDAGYTPGETEYADGEGTSLEQEIKNPDEDKEEDERNAELGHS